MTKETIGLISGLIVVLSVVPYGIRVWQKKINPNITTWSLWSLIGLSLLLTYKSSGAGANVWPVVFGFINPCLITALTVYQKGERTVFNRLEKICIGFCLFSFIGWWWLRLDHKLVQYALYISIIAHVCATVPTINFIWRRPDGDRPFAWLLFALAYSLAVLAAPEPTIANYALPVWMVFGSVTIAVPMVWYRLQNHIPLTEWV